jgi:LysR family transcriptional regulator, glycine cleavage system transcriptional activator
LRRSRLPLTALRAFEAAGRHQSFRLAAGELAVSEAAVSRQVRGLEELLGEPLFLRQHRAVRLTTTGARLLAEVTKSFDMIDAALRETQLGQRAQEFTVSVEPTFATLFLVPRLASFSAAHPGVVVNVEVSASLSELDGDAAHLAIRHSLTKSAWPRSEARHLLDVRLTPMLKGNDNMQVTHPRVWTGDIHLLHDESQDSWSEWIALAGGAHVSRSGATFSNSAVALQGAASGQGMALGSRILAKELLESGALMAPFEHELPRGAYWLLARKFEGLNKAEASFCSWLSEEVAQASTKAP